MDLSNIVSNSNKKLSGNCGMSNAYGFQSKQRIQTIVFLAQIYRFITLILDSSLGLQLFALMDLYLEKWELQRIIFKAISKSGDQD